MQGIPKAQNNDVVILTNGQVLFEQGDSGGDLFFVQTGEIEIYTVTHGKEFSLGVMGPNEVIGMMTFLTKEPRMACARAKGEVVLKKINQSQIKGQIKDLQPWMKVVLKDFTLKLRGMNEKFSQAREKISDLQKSQLSYLYLVRQICSITTATAKLLSINVDGKDVVVIKDYKDYLEQALMVSEELVDKLLEVLIESGMLPTFVELDRKRKVFSVEDGQKLISFAQFITDAKKGQNKKILAAQFANKDLRILVGLVSFAKRLELDPKKESEIKLTDLTTSMEKMIGIKFNVEGLKLAQKLKLIDLKSENKLVTFIPSQLSRTLTNLKTYRKIEKIESIDIEKKKQGL